ncbi:unnamed protein product, partial [Effrenium voratum]
MNNQEMKNLVEEPESSSAKELPSAERAERLRNQAARLVGISLEGESECGHVCYNAVLDMLEKNAVQYLPPSKFVSRKSELSNDKSSREIVLDGASTLKVRDKRPDLSCDTSSELLLVQALHRRALALDLMNAVTFSVSQRYNSFLIGHLQTPPPPGYRKLNVHQILQADKQAWLRLAELATAGLKRNAAGQLPLDVLFQNLQVDPRVMFYLLPLPESSGGHAVVAAECGLQESIDVDHMMSRKLRAPAIKLDLSSAKRIRTGIIHSVRSSGDLEMDNALYEVTQEELRTGWLHGPYRPSDLSESATVTRRFAVRQNNKIRPIDDYTESLVNSTSASGETITLHGVETICATSALMM